MAAQREWFEKDYYKTLGVEPSADRQGDHQGLPQARPRPAPRQEPRRRRRRGEVQGGRLGVRRARRRCQTQGVRRGPRHGADGRHGRRGAPVPVDSRSTSTTWAAAASATCSATCSAVVARAAGEAAPPRASARDAAPTSPPQLTVDFEDAVSGITTTLYLTTDAQCSTCNGSGAKPGTSPSMCSACGGRGVVDDNQGMFSFSTPCRVCGGQGVRIEDPCPTCRGSGVEKRQREVKTRIPAGVKDGQTIRLKGRGGPGRNGGPAGDLLVELKVMPHPLFGRSGNNLTVTVPVTYPEAALGGDIDVPTLDGTSVTLRLRARHPDRQSSPREGQGHRNQAPHRRSDRDGRRRRCRPISPTSSVRRSSSWRRRLR